MVFWGNQSWVLGIGIGIIGLVSLFFLKDAIDWEYYIKNPPGLEAPILKLLSDIPFYKQLTLQDRSKFEQRLALFMIAHEYKIQPVSYTHLDVYKRQCLSLEPLLSELPFNPQIQQYLEWSRTRKKTLSIFPATVPQMIKTISKSEFKDIPTPDRSIELSKYDEFEDVFSFFKELNTPLKFKLDKNKRIIATIYNTEMSSELEGKPVFIIDGRVTDRADWIARLPMETIKKVDIFFNTKILLNYFGMIGRNGMIIMQTKTNLNMPDSIVHFENKLNGYIPLKGSFELKKEQIESRHIPLFKPLVYWNGNIEFDRQGRASIK